MVHIRKLEGKVYTFIVSGKLWRNSLIMQDKETGSLWSQITGEALEGKLQKKKLSMIPSVQTSWGEWFREHPDTKLLRKEKAVKGSYYEKYFADPERTGLFRVQWLRERMPGKDFVLGVARGPHSLAVSEKKLYAAGIVNARLGGDPIVMVQSEDGGARAFVARAESGDLHFRRADDPSVMVDEETGSLWNVVEGTCFKGKLKGVALESVIVRRAFWFAWSAFFPNTGVID